MIDNKWYYENTATVILTAKGKDIVEKQLVDLDVCPECGAPLCVVTMMEGSFISCTVNMYHKSAGYEIDCGDYTTPPKLVR